MKNMKIVKIVLKKTVSLVVVFAMLIPTFLSRKMKVVLIGDTEIIIHYQEGNQNTKDWNL